MAKSTLVPANTVNWTLRRRMLARATAVLGEEVLAKRLGVSRTRLSLWLMGADGVPPWIFLRLVDVLLAPLDTAAHSAPQKETSTEARTSQSEKIP